MKNKKIITSIVFYLSTICLIIAQENNLVMNGSFESISENVNSTGEYYLADSILSSNNTTVDLYNKNACGHDYTVPSNYMGTQTGKTGNNYVGIIANYADDAGLIKTKPGYQKYSEYIQLKFTEPLLAGKMYSINFNVSLAEKSAYAVSGLGIYFSASKINVKNNSFLQITPHAICPEILTNTEWTTITSVYVANGGERYLTLGCFDKYMNAKKITEPFTNNSRKAYYYIDDISVTPQAILREDLTSILSGSCYQLNNLNFETDKAIILSNSYNELTTLSTFLKSYPSVMVYINGYTDKTGTTQHNEILSEERAAAVKAYLVNEGVDTSRLKARGYGEKLAIDMKNENSLANRRVEITVCATH